VISNDAPLTCGCTSTQPCEKAAQIFAKGTHWRGPLLQHLAAGARLPKLRRSRLHNWAYCRDGVVLKRCRNCNLEHTSGRQLGKSAGATRYTRHVGGEWVECPPLPDCVVVTAANIEEENGPT